jgi:hypothetical protein
VSDLRRGLLILVASAALGACGDDDRTGTHEGRPSGPYLMTLETVPAQPQAGESTLLTTRITQRASREPPQNLQVLHERLVHNFIVNLDFSSFAHIHHEDFAPLTARDIEDATLHFPYTFSRAGTYRMVSEFTHQQRSWTKHFDIKVGAGSAPQPQVNLEREKVFGAYRARLSASPALPVAGFETELVLELARDSVPVTDLQLVLGSEIHVAVWRLDGQYFGHTHSYTPHMAMMMASMHDRAKDAPTRARLMSEMMLAMMDAPAQLVFSGPRVPVHYVFPEPGTYALFLHCAPGGEPRVFDFMVDVVAHAEGLDTHIESIVDSAQEMPH